MRITVKHLHTYGALEMSRDIFSFVLNKKGRGIANKKIFSYSFSLHRTQPLLLIIFVDFLLRNLYSPHFISTQKERKKFKTIKLISFHFQIFFIFPLLAYAIISLHLNVIFFIFVIFFSQDKQIRHKGIKRKMLKIRVKWNEILNLT